MAARIVMAGGGSAVCTRRASSSAGFGATRPTSDWTLAMLLRRDSAELG